MSKTTESTSEKDYAWEGRLRNGRVIRVRPMHAVDAALERDFLSRLTTEELGYCFLGIIKPRRDDIATELTQVDEGREVGLVALVDEDGDERQVGSARYRVSDDGTRCDCAVAVDPAWRHCGVGGILMRHLIGVARMQGIQRMYAVDAARCAGSHELAGYLGFRSRPDPEDPAAVTFELELDK